MMGVAVAAVEFSVDVGTADLCLVYQEFIACHKCLLAIGRH